MSLVLEAWVTVCYLWWWGKWISYLNGQGGVQSSFLLQYFSFWLHWVLVAAHRLLLLWYGLSCHGACGILVPQGTEPMSPVLAGRFLTTGPPGMPCFNPNRLSLSLCSDHITNLAHFHPPVSHPCWWCGSIRLCCQGFGVLYVCVFSKSPGLGEERSSCPSSGYQALCQGSWHDPIGSGCDHFLWVKGGNRINPEVCLSPLLL